MKYESIFLPPVIEHQQSPLTMHAENFLQQQAGDNNNWPMN
jgi:hypothetical protein